MSYVSCHESVNDDVNKKIPKRHMEGKRENDSSTKAWYIKCEVYTTINKIYERVTNGSTHEIRK